MSDNRRDAIADAAIEIIATEGLRSLTHRAIDSRLDYPTGSTSYYLRTRRALVEAVVSRLSKRTFDDLAGDGPATLPSTAEEAARLLAGLLKTMAETRPHDHLARFALRIDLLDDRELHQLIADQSPIRSRLLETSAAMLAAIGVDQPERHASDLVALVDGLLFDRLTNGPAAGDPQMLLTAYLRGLK